jgi:hypothetical protein
MKQKLIDFLNVFVNLQKALVMLLLILLGIVFRVENLISGDNFVDLLKNTVIAFFAVHATQHIVATMNAYYNNKNLPDDTTVVAADAPTPSPAKGNDP